MSSWSMTTAASREADARAFLSANGIRVRAAAAAPPKRGERMRGPRLRSRALVDVMMPGESGLELTRKLRDENARCRS
jgi:CheY-like chemotaxis protein